MKEDGSYKFKSIQYDSRNLPIFVEKGEGSEIIYLYSAEGQRIFKKVDNNAGEHYIMDGSLNVGVFTEDGSLKHWNLLADGVAGRIETSGRLYYLTDHLGSTRTVIDESGLVVESHDYYPFGLQMPGRDFLAVSVRTKELFTGKELDDETRLYHLVARRYDPATGKMWSVDPASGLFPSLSPYSYAANNPLIIVDRDGRIIDTIFDVASIGFDLFDIGRSIVRGEGVSATQGLALAADVGALFIPFVAGGGLAVRGLSKADEVVDAVKVLQKNKTIGKQGEKIVTESLQKEFGEGKKVLEQVTGKFDDATTTRLDNVVVDQKTKKIVLVNETKTGNATFSKQQKRFFKKGESLTLVGKKAKKVRGRRINTNNTLTRKSRVDVKNKKIDEEIR